jgi:hypothetical protein
MVRQPKVQAQTISRRLRLIALVLGTNSLSNQTYANSNPKCHSAGDTSTFCKQCPRNSKVEVIGLCYDEPSKHNVKLRLQTCAISPHRLNGGTLQDSKTYHTRFGDLELQPLTCIEGLWSPIVSLVVTIWKSSYHHWVAELLNNSKESDDIRPAAECLVVT